MPVDPYASCTCGSGKKFKWCCGPIHEQLERAFKLEANGQHEAALRIVNEISNANPDNPEVFGRKALLLYQLGRAQEAEAALDRSFQLNPNYPYGFLLRGEVLKAEGEIQGALLMYRKAVDYYDPSSQEILAQLNAAIAEIELQLNRPVAARAAWETAIKYQPGNADLREGLKRTFGDESGFPLAARQPYHLKAPPDGASPEKKQIWQQALQQHTAGKWTEGRHAFEKLVAENADDAAAWYNLALLRAWLGDNFAAVQALDEYVGRESDQTQAADAWTLAEVLRCGGGVPETESDHVEYSCMYQIRDGNKIKKLMEYLEQNNKLLGGRLDQERQVFTAILAETPKLLAAGAGAPQVLRFGAHMLLVQNLLRISGPSRQGLLTAAAELEEKADGGLQGRREQTAPLQFHFVLMEAVLFPIGEMSDEDFQKQFAEGTARFLEDGWIHRPLRALGNIAPVDAAGQATLRNKLRGVIQFLEQCAKITNQPYDFDRLRRKLGLQTAAAAPAAGAIASPDIPAMSAADLAGLSAATLSDEQLEQAAQTARKLDARALAASFLETLVARPPAAGKPDRFPWFGQLIQHALEENNTDKAMEFVDAGEKADCEQNEGRRRNDYELWRARLHARRGELGQAQDVFDRLIARVPADLRYRSTAAEAMLSAKDGARALHFAQNGLTAARQQKDRDSEQHFLELAEAAKKRG